jgi:hypothetical protein
MAPRKVQVAAHSFASPVEFTVQVVAARAVAVPCSKAKKHNVQHEKIATPDHRDNKTPPRRKKAMTLPGMIYSFQLHKDQTELEGMGSCDLQAIICSKSLLSRQNCSQSLNRGQPSKTEDGDTICLP